MGSKKPDIPQQNLGVDISKIFNAFKGQLLPGFESWQNQPALQQLNQFISGTEIPQLTGLLNKFPDPYKTTAPLQTLLQNQPSINQTLAPIQRALGQLPSAGSFAAPIQRVSQGLQERMANLMNVAPTLRQGLATQAPIIASAGATTRDQQQAAQQQALGTAALQGNAFGNQANLANILNQQKYKDARLQGAIQNVTGLEGIQGQDVAARLGLGTGITSAQQAQQGVFNQDLAARSGVASLMDQLRSSDVNRRMGLTQGIQGLIGTNLAQRLGLMQGITGAITQPLMTGEESFMKLLGPLLGFGGNVFDANQNAAAAQSIAGANKNSGVTSGILSSLGTVAGGALAASDEKLKANVRETGKTTPDGIPIKTFTYRGEPKRRYVGVMAQDVEKKVPSAVVTLPVSGHKLVNRSVIDVPFYEIKKRMNESGNQEARKRRTT